MTSGSKIRTSTDIETMLGCGFYQFFMFIFYQLAVFLQCANMAFMSFGKVAPTKWSCQDWNQTVDFRSSEIKNFSDKEQCALLANRSCENFVWETDFYSIASEWQLICERTGIVYLIMSVQMFGVLVGSPLFGQLSDTLGRKWTLFAAQLILILLDGLSVFSPNWQAFLIFRFFIGVSCGGTITICFVYFTEVLKSRHRLWMTTIGGWPPAFAVFAGLAIATRDWKRLSLAIGALGIPSLLMIPFAAESPRWLLEKQKLDRAQRSIKQVQKWNREDESVKAKLPNVIGGHQQLSHPLRPNSDKRRGQRYTFWHLCQTGKMSLNISVLIFAYLSVSTITYGIIFNNDKLTGNIFLNFLLFAIIRWVASVSTPAVDAAFKCCGRKLMSSVSFAIISLASAVISFIVIFAPNDKASGIAVTVLVLVASTLTSPVWAALNLTSVEAFPTPIRNIAVGVCGVFTRLGGAIVPMFLYMAELWAPSPYVLFAFMALISAILCGFFLPETKGKPLPDKMPQPQKRWWCCCGENKRPVGSHQKPEGTIRSDSFTVYQFSDGKTSNK